MPLRSLSRLGARLLSVLLLAGCARDAAAPVEPTGARPSTPSPALAGTLTATTASAASLTVRAVTRTTTLPSDVSVTAVIGRAGGTLSIPGAGLTLVVPAGAVGSDVKFTATAVAGRLVAYEFEPHGITFAVPLRFTQDLAKVSLAGVLGTPAMDGDYFADRGGLSQSNGTAVVSERKPATVDLGTSHVTFPVNHFSGYLISWH